MIIDLRSDTLTKPTPAMKEAMFSAEVGDDVFEEDPTVNALEAKAAALFGHEAALFCPSGTMTNQIAIKVHTLPGSEVICDQHAHIYLYEGGGMAFNSGASVKLLEGDRGRISSEQVTGSINPDNVHFPATSLVALENTCNRGGGCYYSMENIQAIRKVCQEANLPMHLDGARLFNALAETGESTEFYGSQFETLSICLSKGLGAPVGSLLIGSKKSIYRARRIRKVFGGGMRQAGILAAAGIYALDNHRNRLTEDHARARALESILQGLPYVAEVLPVDTNIVVFTLEDSMSQDSFLQKAEEKYLKAVPFGPGKIRLVTHLDFGDEHLQAAEQILKSLA